MANQDGRLSLRRPPTATSPMRHAPTTGKLMASASKAKKLANECRDDSHEMRNVQHDKLQQDRYNETQVESKRLARDSITDMQARA